LAKVIRKLTQIEQLNFLLTNRVPRKLLTRIVGWYSDINSPLLTKITIYLWRLFVDDLDLEESKHKKFNSLQSCFTRELKDGARPIDMREEILVSPCDGIIGEFGDIQGTTVYQAKGFPYELSELIPDYALQERYRDGVFVTLRLKSSMYHRFHAPLDCQVSEINYISGDTWNVNPVALKRVEKLYCRNERAVMTLNSEHQEKSVTLVPVAAILVASMRFKCLDMALNLQYRGENRLACNASYEKGEELGYFQHGSTIIVFATSHYSFCENIQKGERISMGSPLLQVR